MNSAMKAVIGVLSSETRKQLRDYAKNGKRPSAKTLGEGKRYNLLDGDGVFYPDAKKAFIELKNKDL